MEWIKEVPESIKEQESNIDNLNFVAKSGNIYFMDNHLAAGWCWLQELDANTSYNFFHIDRHNDLLMNADPKLYEFIKQEQNLSLEKYASLEFEISNHTYKVFQWDNYILQIKNLFPDWFNECYFCTHDKFISDPNIDISYQPDVFELYDNIDYWTKGELKWVLNLDLDFFFSGNGYFQLFTDDYIRKVAESIKKSLPNIAVLTVSLSSECCGGWDNSIRIANMIAEILEVDFRL